MSKHHSVQTTQHALLVAWGWFASQIGLVTKLLAVPLGQKRRHHTPQAKVLEFLVAVLAGMEHLQDISRSAHPLDQDQALAEAWGVSGWADYSGVSRTLSRLSQEEAQSIAAVLEEVSRPYLEAELSLLRASHQRLCYDGDLTGLPVSNTSQTYPGAAFGYMDADIRLGYQAAVVSLVSPTYGRLWLSVAHHPGDTVSVSQAEALVRAAEQRTGLRPRRRTELVQRRLQDVQRRQTEVDKRRHSQERLIQRQQVQVSQRQEESKARHQALLALENHYQAQQRRERPTSALAQARKRWAAAERRWRHAQHRLQQAQQRLAKTQAQREALQDEVRSLQERLIRLEQENAQNPEPIAAEFRLDAGFGSYDNLALLIELGYEVYTKAYGSALTRNLKRQTDGRTSWTRVGRNAEMVCWAGRTLQGCPYPLDVALARFHTGQTCQHSVLLHYGQDAVTADPAGWFAHYNGRQIIEAGIKEGKQVFYLHRFKVRSAPAIYLQEQFVIFAANFIRWATCALSPSSSGDDQLDVQTLGIKRQVQVAAHTSATVVQTSEGKLLRFSPQSVFAGKVLRFPQAEPLPSRRPKSWFLMPVFVKAHLVAQKLR